MDEFKMALFRVGLSLTIVLSLVNNSYGIDCEIDSSIGWFDPDNVYQCPSDQKCCVESGKASCCSNQALSDETLDQVKLWGTVFGVVFVIAILVCCCRKDNNCCDGDATCCYYLTCRCLCGKCRKPSNDIEYQKFPPPSPSNSTTSSKKSHLQDAPHKLTTDPEITKIPPLPNQPIPKPPLPLIQLE